MRRIVQKVEKGVIEFRKTLVTLIISAFGFVAALIWRDVIKAFFTEVLGLEWGINFLSTFLVAVFITVFLVAFTLILTKFVNIKVKK